MAKTTVADNVNRTVQTKYCQKLHSFLFPVNFSFPLPSFDSSEFDLFQERERDRDRDRERETDRQTERQTDRDRDRDRDRKTDRENEPERERERESETETGRSRD